MAADLFDDEGDDVPRSSRPNAEEETLTHYLGRWSDGDEDARDTLIRRVLPELRRLAASKLRRERSDHTLQPTALVNEAFARLLKQRALTWEGRSQFFAFAGELMRRVLVDHARTHKAAKRGQGIAPLPLDDFEIAPEQSEEILALDDALKDLERFNPDGARAVTLRYFGGLNHQEVGEAMGVSRMKARRLWTEARAWLYLQLNQAPSESPEEEES